MILGSTTSIQRNEGGAWMQQRFQGAEVFQEGYGVEDGIATTPGFQDLG